MLSQCVKRQRAVEVRKYSLGYWLLRSLSLLNLAVSRKCLFKNQASVALNPLVSLFGRLVVRSAHGRRKIIFIGIAS